MSRSSGFVTPLIGHSVPFLVLFLIAVVMLGANPLAGETIAPFDILTRLPGWKNTGIVSPVKHHKHSDVLDYKLPSWRFAREKLRQGELPVWNPHVLGGEPLLLSITRSIITPAFAAYAVIDDEGVGLYVSALLNLLVISVGSYLLFLSLTGNRLAALLGAVAFSYSGFNLSWFLWHHVNTSIWIPWLLFFALRLLQTGDARHVAWLALSSAMMLLGGFPTVAVYGYIALLLLLVCWSLFSGNRLRLVLQRDVLASLGILLSLMLAFLFLFCLDESLGRLDLSYRRGGTAFRSLQDLLLFVLPFSDGPLTLGRTGYVGLLPLVLFFPAFWLAWKTKLDWRYAWGFSLIIVISPIAFAWVPMEAIRQIPLIGTSMISRLILIIGLGFSVLTVLVLAAGYERFGKGAPRWANLVLVLLLLVQVADQRHVFQTLVGHVNAETIYPSTATIDYVSNNIEPLQSVLSDRGYLLPGVLSAYGLSEWFAHGFRTRQEKQLLEGVVDGPFLTPTAAGFLCDQVRFDDAQGLTQLAVRYVLCSVGPRHGDNPGRQLVFDTVAKQSAENRGLDLARHKVVQLVDLSDSITFDRIEVPLLSINAAKSPMLSLELISLSNTAAVSAPCELQRDSKSDYLLCSFPEQVRLDKGRYEIELVMERSEEDVSVVVGVYDSNTDLLQLAVDDVTSDRVLGLRGYRPLQPSAYQTLFSGGNQTYSVIEPEPGMVLVENRRVKGGAYFVSTLNGQPQYDLLKTSRYRATAMQFEYMGNEPGWVVIPVRNYPGWSFAVNDRPVEPDLLKGVLPAVPVRGGESIEYSYRPVHYLGPAMVSIVGLLLCLGLFFKARIINQWLSDQEN
ncbi:hypothetical protein [Candidatus Thiodiazotropha sp. CDECU1]|uniref:hypothetical protein n=1 Tax=Candidatus Thiodiazotropha sp. CDECU1 TaxID=3065865 RepID=UPI002930ACCD|nr:hypothetical protein [Candidatus Thiodiazotropha sp. CDECU1]